MILCVAKYNMNLRLDLSHVEINELWLLLNIYQNNIFMANLIGPTEIRFIISFEIFVKLLFNYKICFFITYDFHKNWYTYIQVTKKLNAAK